MTAIGRILNSERDEGTGFALGPRLVVTANHVVRACDHAALCFAIAERRIAVERVEGDEELDVAVLHLAEDAPAALAVGGARCDADWRVESRPRDNDPLLTGRINAIDRIITNRGRKEVQVIQLLVDQALGWHAGYSGSPVTSPPDVAIGVLVEQVLSRLPQAPDQRSAATNVLYAIPIEAVLERFGLAAQVRRGAPAPAQVAERVSGLRISPNVEHWRDRDKLRDDLRRLLLAGKHRVICVVGRRGIGKSAVVAKVLLEFEEDDPAREPLDDLSPLVYLSSRRSTDLTLPAVYQAVAAVWGEDGAHLAEQWQKRKVDALPEMWQKLRNRRPVLVLDNLDDLQDPSTRMLEDPELVALLESACLTPASPTVVTTSQRPPHLPNDLAQLIHVLEIPDGLTGADAVAIIRSGAPRGANQLASIDDGELARLAERVEGRPRGLQKLGLLLDQRPRLRRRLLESESPPDEIVDELVSTSYAVLPDDERLVVQLLALARAPLPEAVVADLLGGLLDHDATLDAIDALVDAGEVKSDPREELLELHPLDADHVRGELHRAPAPAPGRARRAPGGLVGDAAQAVPGLAHARRRDAIQARVPTPLARRPVRAGARRPGRGGALRGAHRRGATDSRGGACGRSRTRPGRPRRTLPRLSLPVAGRVLQRLARRVARGAAQRARAGGRSRPRGGDHRGRPAHRQDAAPHG